MPNATGGLIVIAPNVQKVATGYTGRRAIVEDARCNACHQELGTFTEDAFHAGQRNDGTTCSWCHTPNRTSSGWSADSTSFVHAIHAATKRTVQYNWHAVSATEGFWQIGYPGILNKCETCHVPGTYDFSASGGRGRGRRQAVPHGRSGHVHSERVELAVHHDRRRLRHGFSFNAATGVTTPAAADDAGDFADGHCVLRLPRLRSGDRALRDQRRLDLQAAQRGPGEDRDLPGLPRSGPDR